MHSATLSVNVTVSVHILTANLAFVNRMSGKGRYMRGGCGIGSNRIQVKFGAVWGKLRQYQPTRDSREESSASSGVGRPMRSPTKPGRASFRDGGTPTRYWV